MSSGSSWWHDLLLQHPGLEPRRRAERALVFFTGFCVREMTDRDVADYHARFPRQGGRITGEWTARYMYDAWTPLFLHRAAPAAKLLVIVRDPIERYRRRLARKLREARSERDLRYMPDAAAPGRYATQLRGLLAFYDREQILVLQYEQCRRDPPGEYARTLRFLGLPDGFQPRLGQASAADDVPTPYLRARRFLGGVRAEALRRLRGVASPPDPELWPDLRLSLLADFEPEVSELQKLVPDLNLGLWPNFAHLGPKGALPQDGEAALSAERRLS